MRISTLVELRWIDGCYRVVGEEGFDYSGPLALCDRGQSKQTAEQARGQSAQDQKNAQASIQKTNADVGNYEGALNNFMSFGRRVYGANGEFMRDQNTLGTTTAAAGANKIAGDLTTNAMRTGENTAGYAGTLAESQRQSSRDLTDQLAKADADRLGRLTAIEGYNVDASKFPAQVHAGLYGTSVDGSGQQIKAAADASKTPGFWDVYLPAVASGASKAAAGA